MQHAPERSEKSDRYDFDSLIVWVKLFSVQEPLEVRLGPAVDGVEFHSALLVVQFLINT